MLTLTLTLASPERVPVLLQLLHELRLLAAADLELAWLGLRAELGFGLGAELGFGLGAELGSGLEDLELAGDDGQHEAQLVVELRPVLVRVRVRVRVRVS